MSINREVDKEDMVHIHMEYCSAIKRNKIWLFIEMWANQGTVLQSVVKKRKVMYINIYMWKLKKMVYTMLFTKQKQRYRCREQTYGYPGDGGWDELEDQYWHIYTIASMHKLNN